ncbi:MAG: hypothetical protein ACOC9A_01040, partial [Candidatus Bipolaricaulota bacterium]
MSKKNLLYIGVALIVTLFFLANTAAGEKIEDKLSRIIKLELGLDEEIYQVIETDYQGEKVVLVVIFGNEKAYNSSLGSDLKSGLREHEGETPVAISALTSNKDVSFRPYAVRIIQNGQTSQADQVFGITDGFTEGRMPEEVPIEGKTFWGSKGIITLGSSFDSTTPFEIKYGNTSASFALESTGTTEEEPERGEISEEDEQTGFKDEDEQTDTEDEQTGFKDEQTGFK